MCQFGDQQHFIINVTLLKYSSEVPVHQTSEDTEMCDFKFLLWIKLKMQLNCDSSLDLTCLLNIHIFHSTPPAWNRGFVLTLFSPQARYPVNVTTVISFRLDKAPSRANKDIIQLFSQAE